MAVGLRRAPRRNPNNESLSQAISINRLRRLQPEVAKIEDPQDRFASDQDY